MIRDKARAGLLCTQSLNVLKCVVCINRLDKVLWLDVQIFHHLIHVSFS